MSASRSSSLRVLKQLSTHSHQTRHLHMTGPATFPSRLLTSDKAAAMPGLSSEAGATAELPKAQGARSVTTTHATSPTRPTAAPKRPSGARHFNVSRALKTPNDSSTIDFAFLPMEVDAAPSPALGTVVVPILPHVSAATRAPPPAAYERVHRVEINTIAADGTHLSTPSAMAEVHDNTAVAVDYSAISSGAARSDTPSVVNAGEARTIARELWRGFVDDLTRPAKPAVA